MTSTISSRPTYCETRRPLTNIDKMADYLDQGHIVVLHNDLRQAHIFHECLPKKDDSKQAKIKKMDEREVRVLYVNVRYIPDILFGKDGWVQGLEERRYKECECSQRVKIREGGFIPRAYEFIPEKA